MAFLFMVIQLVVATVVCIYAYFIWSYQYWKNKNVPYLKPRAPFGNLVSPYRRKMILGMEVANLYKQAKANGWKYCGIYSVANPVLLTVDLDFTKDVMNKYFNHFMNRGIYYNERDEPIGAHLFAIGGTKWKNLRAKLSPTFTSGKMRGMFSTLVACGGTLEEFLEKQSESNSSINIKETLMKYTIDIIGSCAFGIECNTFEDPNSAFFINARKIFQRSTLANLKSMLLMSSQKIGRLFRLKLLNEEVSNFFYDVVRETVSYRKINKVVRPDFLQLLIDILQEDGEYKGDGKSLTFDEMVAQCFVFFLAGFETSSTTMTFAIYELTKNPVIQNNVRTEILQVLKKHNHVITYDALKEMKYLGQVIDETLRKYPPVPLITRQCVEDWKDSETGVKIEKGTRVFIPVIGYHYDSQYFKDPDVFDPERFSEEAKQNRHPYSHIPFGEGPRLCIGMRFGLMQTKVGLVSILRDHKVTLNEITKEPLEFDSNAFIPTTKGGIWVNLERIK